MSYTAGAFIDDAAMELGCSFPGQVVTPDIKAAALRRLNNLIGSWQLDRLKILAIINTLYTLTAGQQFYTIGPVNPSLSGFTHLPGVRPLQIENANIVLNTASPSVRQPTNILLPEEWAAIRVQQIPSAIPLGLWYDQNFYSPEGYGKLELWPGPLANYQLELFTWQQLQSFTDLTTVYYFAPGYERMIMLNLAIEIAPMLRKYQKIPENLFQQVLRNAEDARLKIESYNAPNHDLVCDPAYTNNRGGAWNFLTGGNGSGL